MCERGRRQAVTVAGRCPDDLTARINGPLVEQAVINLVDNAVKYSEAGATVADRRRGARAAAWSIRVKDEGCGIASHHLPRLFERFYRVDKARSRELGGTGLGLAIVKHIVAAHQGSVKWRARWARAACFRFRCPAAARQRYVAQPPSAVQVQTPPRAAVLQTVGSALRGVPQRGAQIPLRAAVPRVNRKLNAVLAYF